MKHPMDGGLPLYGHREISTRLPVEHAPIPEELVLPLSQHIGTTAEPVVKVGDRVSRGQLIAAARGFVSANLHAPVNATVKAIEPRLIPHPSGLTGQCMMLAPVANAKRETNIRRW